MNDQFARFMKSLAGLHIGPENSTPLGGNVEKKFPRFKLLWGDISGWNYCDGIYQVEFWIWKVASPHLELSSRPMQRRNVVDSEPAYETYRVFFNWYPPKKLKYEKPRLGESTAT